ncbi:MAG: UDP-N-acetylmuramate--L-alanine ligase [Nitrospirae bacterium]|nr:MAG: UDP-N-acetylmuramate--L-alanine ligase [Nitrospirota bacterium]
MFERYRIIHFVGIGGIGMSGIAEVLRNLGYEVTGSDLRESATTERLRRIGVKVYIGHDPNNVDSAHVVVTSSAVKDDNPEVIEARRRSIPVIPRAEMLAELGRLKYSVLIAGSHGKTTTTSLVGHILAHTGMDPTVVIGGILKSTGSNARLGQGEFLVAEADESDGSFLKLSPTIALATNIDREHMDYFKDMETLAGAFRSFLEKVPFYGASIVCNDDPILREMGGSLRRPSLSYGLTGDADITAVEVRPEEGGVSFLLYIDGEPLGRFLIPLIGRHNVLNTLGAIGVARELRIDMEDVRIALQEFPGIQRRFEFKGERMGVRVYDDYGHHPTEIKALLSAVRENLSGRIVVIFQPHRYTRTRDLFYEFLEAFDEADLLYLMDIYPAGESPIPGVSTSNLNDALHERGINSVYISDRETLVESVTGGLREGDILITLGAGDVWKIGEEIVGSNGDK